MKTLTKAMLVSLVFISNSAHAIPITPVHYWAEGEYLYWWPNDSSLNVPLATANNTGSLAIIGLPGTEIVLGPGSSRNNFDFHGMGGARITLGGWINNACIGVEVSGFSLAPRTATLVASSGPTYPVLDVPFFSTLTGTENVLVGGRTNTVTDKNTFQPTSIELNALYRFPCPTRFPVILTAGIRYMNIDDKLVLNDAIYGTPSLPPNAVLNVEDKFSSRNHFFGLQVGARTKIDYCHFRLEAKGEIAVGINYQRLAIDGETNVNDITILENYGLFAEPTNIGSYNNNEISILPELQLKFSYNCINYLRPFITYTVMYMNNVNRAAKQIDRNINTSQNVLLGGTGVLSGPANPIAKINQSSFWLQGLSIGVEFG